MSEWKSPRALHPAERKALRWLRLAAIEPVGNDGPERGIGSPLASVFDAHSSSRSDFLAPDAPFVAPGERQFLQLAAFFQRMRLPRSASMPRLALAASVAARLLDAGVRLPPSSSPELLELLKLPIGSILSTAEAYADAKPRAGTIRARIVRLIEEHGPASRNELMALGMSRQYLSLLVRSGTVIRIGNLYSLAPAESRSRRGQTEAEQGTG